MPINYDNIVSGSFYKHGELFHITPLSASGHFEYFQHGQPVEDVVGFFFPPPVAAAEEEEEGLDMGEHGQPAYADFQHINN